MLSKLLSRVRKPRPQLTVESSDAPETVPVKSLSFFIEYEQRYRPLSVIALCNLAYDITATLRAAAKHNLPSSELPSSVVAVHESSHACNCLPAAKTVERALAKSVIYVEDIVGACVLLLRLWNTAPQVFLEDNCDALFLGALLLAAKSLAPIDDIYNNAAFAICSKSTTISINALEAALLNVFDWAVTLHVGDYADLIPAPIPPAPAAPAAASGVPVPTSADAAVHLLESPRTKRSSTLSGTSQASSRSPGSSSPRTTGLTRTNSGLSPSLAKSGSGSRNASPTGSPRVHTMEVIDTHTLSQAFAAALNLF
eukprot:TRINITY_DN4383_c0_g1_i1.p1 TRINITY_DN4383_c0_g1~~TRINITY_DN4383_c0_g1_i1.p1  ORF type:complete len:312 (+),score=44.65 TRINITY_DN4383_c0_g1_i1:17-952(+)